MSDNTITAASIRGQCKDLSQEDFDKQLTALVEDCKARPGINKARELTLKLRIKPHPEDPDDVMISPVTTRKMPARGIEPIRARRTPRNQLQFDWMDDGEWEKE